MPERGDALVRIPGIELAGAHIWVELPPGLADHEAAERGQEVRTILRGLIVSELPEGHIDPMTGLKIQVPNLGIVDVERLRGATWLLNSIGEPSAGMTKLEHVREKLLETLEAIRVVGPRED